MARRRPPPLMTDFLEEESSIVVKNTFLEVPDKSAPSHLIDAARAALGLNTAPACLHKAGLLRASLLDSLEKESSTPSTAYDGPVLSPTPTTPTPTTPSESSWAPRHAGEQLDCACKSPEGVASSQIGSAPIGKGLPRRTTVSSVQVGSILATAGPSGSTVPPTPGKDAAGRARGSWADMQDDDRTLDSAFSLSPSRAACAASTLQVARLQLQQPRQQQPVVRASPFHSVGARMPGPPPLEPPKLPPGFSEQSPGPLPGVPAEDQCQVFACVANAPEPKFAPPAAPAPDSRLLKLPVPAPLSSPGHCFFAGA